MKKRLPAYLKQYFWDVDFDKLDGQKYSIYVISRIMDKGSPKAIRWLTKNYSPDLIKKTLMTRRGINPRSANFWALLLGVDKRKVVCLQKPYLKMRQALWPY